MVEGGRAREKKRTEQRLTKQKNNLELYIREKEIKFTAQQISTRRKREKGEMNKEPNYKQTVWCVYL
jgi:hypothetical protein